MAMNKNGIYKFSSFFNENKNIEFKFDSFFFEESIKIKTLIDYEFYVKNKKRIVKLFKDSGNNLSIYNNNNSGIIEIKNPINEYKIEVSDFDGNKTVIIIPIKKTITGRTSRNSSPIEFIFTFQTKPFCLCTSCYDNSFSFKCLI